MERSHRDPLSIDTYIIHSETRAGYPIDRTQGRIVRERRTSFQPRDWPALPLGDCRYVAYLELLTGKLKLLLWNGSRSPSEGYVYDDYLNSLPAMAELVDDKRVPVVGSKTELNALVSMDLREQIQSGRRPVVRAEPVELLEAQPAALAGLEASRRHRRFANLWWEQGPDLSFTLKRAAEGRQFNALTGAEEAPSLVTNPAALLLDAGVDITSVWMEPDGGGFALPDADPWTVVAAFAEAPWDRASRVVGRPLLRSWSDPVNGSRTETSERGCDKVQGRARLDLAVSRQTGASLIVSVGVAVETFTWAGVGPVGAWVRGSHGYAIGAQVYTQAERAKLHGTPLTSVESSGASDGRYEGYATFDTTLPPNSGLYVCVWWYVRHDAVPERVPGDRALGARPAAVCVNGELVFDSTV